MGFYFENDSAEICYNEDHFIDEMKDNGITLIEIIKAEKVWMDEAFYCKHFGEVSERGVCGKGCKSYQPKNKISGCCNHLGQLYEHGKKIILVLKGE